MTRPPAWLIAATVGMASVLLLMAVAETSFKGHYLIDQGEYLSLVGLAFILGAGVYLHRQRRLRVSLPLVFPWLLYPVITQGDEIIDNLSINAMRAVVHVLLAMIFAMPVAVVALGARTFITPARGATSWWTAVLPGLRPLAQGREREGAALLAASLLVMEMWLAHVYLGTLMIVTLVILVLAVLLWGSVGAGAPGADAARRRQHGERTALVVLAIGVVLSFGLYVGFKNRPGAYQGSPSFYMDPSQQASRFNLDRVPVPTGAPSMPAAPEAMTAAFSAYGRGFERLLGGYYVLDRNYNYHFHNELFLQRTPLLPNYRAVGLRLIDEGRQARAGADRHALEARAAVGAADPLGALLDDVQAYAAFSFDRAATIERMSAGFERTKNGLQHATHIYEGEGKFLGVGLAGLLAKHHGVIDAPALAPVTADFVAAARRVHDKYANRIVGF